MPESNQVTRLLQDWSQGDASALNELTPLVYDELRRLARQHIRRERPGHTLEATALAHEAYLRLVDQRRVQWRSRAHFFAIAATLMRRILVDHARSRHYAKRGAGVVPVSLDNLATLSDERAGELVALDDVLADLERVDRRKSRVVELKFFGGLTTEEAAEVLGISPRTVERDWDLAQAWLYRAMKAP